MGRRLGLRKHEHGFTLTEVLVTIILMGIVFAIASSTWIRVVESRNVDSATNQVAADLRLASTSASNRLIPWRVALTDGSQSYQLIKLSTPTVTTTHWLPDGTEIGTTIIVEFAADGSATVITGSGNTIVVRSTDGSPQHTIDFNLATSRIKVVS
jgi:prepilin-type N-terminal cleavage/methylation domain-containing protein